MKAIFNICYGDWLIFCRVYVDWFFCFIFVA